jgi:hypothetical protein
MTREETFRKLIQATLEQGLKFGLDAAGAGLMGPAWLVVRPLLEKILGELPKDIAKRYKSSQEAVDEAAAALKAHEAEIATIAEALDHYGMTEEWARSLLENMDRLSDDMLSVLHEQTRQGRALNEILALTKQMADAAGARLVLRGERLEYVGYLRVPDSFEPGFDLAPDSHMDAPFAGRHMPRGFLLSNHVVANDGRRSATVSRMSLEIVRTLPPPVGAEVGSLAPVLTPFEDRVVLEPGKASYSLFTGKQFHYKPDEADAFRISVALPSDTAVVQQLRIVIEWEDGSGRHSTYSPSIFLASAPAMDVEALAAHAKIKFGFA